MKHKTKHFLVFTSLLSGCNGIKIPTTIGFGTASRVFFGPLFLLLFALFNRDQVELITNSEMPIAFYLFLLGRSGAIACLASVLTAGIGSFCPDTGVFSVATS